MDTNTNNRDSREGRPRANPRSLRICQVNLHGAKLPSNELKVVMDQYQFDIALVQEVYTKLVNGVRVIPSMGPGSFRVSMSWSQTSNAYSIKQYNRYLVFILYLLYIGMIDDWFIRGQSKNMTIERRVYIVC
uniref:Endonuclease/exonuclease/phosphatase domain-containing protein n=1 Tax=Cacopsylla melanoneura TaxID=428564 RepID=A0A8D9BA15_9HEMI